MREQSASTGVSEARDKGYNARMGPERLSSGVAARYDHLQTILRSCGRVAVAFSGGVDSAVMLKAAVETLGPDNVVAVTGRSASLADREYADACAIAECIGARHVILDTNEFENVDYVSNPQNRCYFCKTTLYQIMASYRTAHGYDTTLSGTNADDLGDWRPGLKAAEEHGVRAPLCEAGLTKSDVRALARRFDLPSAEKPASPCLSSRVPYGQTVTPQKLQRIERGEALLRDRGFSDCRVRHHEDLARIEVPSDEVHRLLDAGLRSDIEISFRALGFLYVTIDIGGLQSGSLNAVLSLPVAD